MLTRESRVAVVDGVLFNQVDGEVVLLNQSTGVYFGLNDAGTHIWELIVRQLALGEIHDDMVRTFEAAPDALWSDLVGLTTELLNEGLIAEVPPSDPAAT